MADPLDPAVLSKILANHVTWVKVVAAVDATLPPEIQDGERRDYIARLAPNDLNDTPKLYRALVDDLFAKGLVQSLGLALFNQGQGNDVLREILSGKIQVDNNGNVTDAALQSIRNATEPFLNSEAFFPSMDAARYRVCAVWVDDQQEPAGIKGTGFLIAPDLVLTARHVVRGLLKQGPGELVGGKIVAPTVAKAGSHTGLALAFDYWTLSSNFKPDAPPAEVRIVRPKEHWLEWSSDTHPGDGVTHVFGAPPIHEYLDCAVIRLSERIGAAIAGRSGSRIRGWLPLNAVAPTLTNGNAIAILQFPGGGPQGFDKGDFKKQDPSATRIWYETETATGSSGSPCFDSGPAVVAFHNAGRPKDYHGETDSCNQGVRIDGVIAAMPKPLIDESRKGWAADVALWSLSENAAQPEPVLGRGKFKKAILDLFDLRSRQRVVIVEQAEDVSAVGKSGKSFSTRVLRAIARGKPGFVVEFRANDVKNLPPEQFLARLGQGIGITDLGALPERPTEERQLSRYWSFDLPQWFGQLLESRAKAAGKATIDSAVDPATGSALGREPLLRELVWIVIDDIHLDPPEGGVKELIAGLMGMSAGASIVGPGLKSLRWLLIGRIPDFVRGRTTDYLLDEVSQLKMGPDEWVECLATAFLSMGEQDYFDAATARAVYYFSGQTIKDTTNPKRMLQALAAATPAAIDSLLRARGRR